VQGNRELGDEANWLRPSLPKIPAEASPTEVSRSQRQTDQDQANGSYMLARLAAARELCSFVHEALPFPLEASDATGVADASGLSCRVSVGRENCTSKHALWNCQFEKGACSCEWNLACHGIAMALKPAADLPLLCGPEEDLCKCRGFESCPLGGHGGVLASNWSCTHMEGSTCTWGVSRTRSDSVTTGLAASMQASIASDTGAKSTFEEMQAKVLSGGVCQCSRPGLMVMVPISRNEHVVMHRSPLEEFTTEALYLSQDKEQTAVSGQHIHNKVTEHDASGKKRVVLTISDNKDTEEKDDSKAKQKADDTRHVPLGGMSPMVKANNQPVKEEQKDTERCVITDGELSFTRVHAAILGAMLVPAIVVAIIVGFIRWGVCLYGTRGGGAEDATYPSINGASRGPPDQRPEIPFVVMLLLLVILLKMNTSVILTTSHIFVKQVSQTATVTSTLPGVPAVAGDLVEAMTAQANGLEVGDTMSGLLLGAEPFGGIFGVILAARFTLARPRQCCLGACAMVLVGSLGFLVALRYQSFKMMLWLRFFSGLAEGSLYVGQLYLSKMSSTRVRTEIFGYWELGTAAGLLGGPCLTSLMGMMPTTEVGSTGEASICMIALLSFALLVATGVAFPVSGNSVSVAEELKRQELQCWSMDASMTNEKRIAQLVVTTCTLIRLLMRLAWEASAVMVLAAHFCLGYTRSGWGVVAVVLIYVLAQAIFIQLSRSKSDIVLVRICQFMELCGLVLIFRMPRTIEQTVEEDIMQIGSSLANIMFFLLGSGIFYAGNCLTSAPLNSWGTKRATREECILFYVHVAIQAGVCVGACLSRLFTGTDPHQNTIVAILLPAVLVQILLTEQSMGTLPEPDFLSKKFGP